MQTTLIQRYLGNKSAIANEIVEIIRSVAAPGELIFDAFSGSLAVSAALRTAGYEVACNDINHFSWLFARAYFSERGLPSPAGWSHDGEEATWQRWQNDLERLIDEDVSDLPPVHRRSDIFDHYCEAGIKSAFLSKRGLSGRRRFFSAENARAIDRALSRIRFRYQSGAISEHPRCVLTAALISAVEKISNTQGTYHDFPRDFVDSRALRPLRLKMPEPGVFCGPVSRFIGKSQDTLTFVETLPDHKVIYIDPPYNFRQYTSYYFMLNLLSRYSEIEDLDEYFRNLEFVRGQNMGDDFKSTFCSRSSFIPSLQNLVNRSKAEYVVLSYFDGRNHWGSFKSSDSEPEGKKLLEDFFSSDTFVAGSFQFLPIERKNYQSYGGHTAKPINEFLFVARKSSLPDVATDVRSAQWIGRNSASEIV